MQRYDNYVSAGCDPNECGSVKYNNCVRSKNKLHDAIPYFKKKIIIIKKEFLLRVVAKNGSGKNSIQPGVRGPRMVFGLG